MSSRKVIGIVVLCCMFLTSTVVGVVEEIPANPTPLDDRAINVDITVYDGSSWVDYLERPVGTDLEFKVDITGAIGLVLVITVVLPEALDYTGESSPPPSDTSGNDLNGTNLYWSYDTGGGSHTVTFHAIITEEGTFEALATGIILLPPISGSDTINITGIASENLPPEIPQKPTGETNGKIDTTYTYSTTTTDPDEDQVYYQWDWGNNELSGWLGPFDSGDLHETNYSWDEQGTYEVKVRSRDIHNATSDWSDPLPVKMPHLTLLSLLQKILSRFPLLRLLFSFS